MHHHAAETKRKRVAQQEVFNVVPFFLLIGPANTSSVRMLFMTMNYSWLIKFEKL